jgi:hypothetical protein
MKNMPKGFGYVMFIFILLFLQGVNRLDVNVAGLWFINCILFPISIYFFRFANKRLKKYTWWNKFSASQPKNIYLYLGGYFLFFLPILIVVGYCISEFTKLF